MATKRRLPKVPASGFRTKYSRGQTVRFHHITSLPPSGSAVGVIVSAEVQSGGGSVESLYVVEFASQITSPEHPLYIPKSIDAGSTYVTDKEIIEVIE